MWLIGGVMVGLVLALLSNRVPAPLSFAVATLLLLYSGLLPSETLLAAFTNETLVGLILLLLVSSVLEKTYFLPWLTQRLFWGRSLSGVLGRLGGFVLLSSSHLNNTAVVAALMGAVKTNPRFAPSKLLIPLSYAAIMGGTLTLVGTSTNLIVSGFAKEAGLPDIGFYDFFYVGAPLSLLGMVYLVGVLPRWLPARGWSPEGPQGEFFLEAQVAPQSRLLGRSVQTNRLRQLDHLFLAEIIREDRLISPVMPEEVLEADDRLIFTGDVKQIQELRKFDGLNILDHIDDVAKSNLQEVVVKHNAPVIGQRVKDTNFRTRFDAVVVGVRRGEDRLPGKIGPMVLRPGDNLVLAVGREFERHDNLRRNFIFIHPIEAANHLNHRESWIAMGGFLLGLMLVAWQVCSLFEAMLGLLALYLGLGYLSTKTLKNQLNLGLMVMIGCSLAIAQVMQQQGLAQALAQGVIDLTGQHEPLAALAGVYLATMLITELVTNNAAAALIFPIAVATAQQLGVSPMPFVMVVAYGASASFLTPIGYQTNTMVYALGNYRFSDYFRAGLGLSLLYGVLTVSLVPYFFPF